MDAVNLFAFSTATFVFTRLLTEWAALYPLEEGAFRAHLRSDRDSHVVLFEWSTANGRISFDAQESLLTMSAPIDEIRRFDGSYVYDCDFLLGETIVPLFGGTLTFQKGVTRPND